MKLKNAISHYALVSSRANNSDAPRMKLRTNSGLSRLRASSYEPGNRGWVGYRDEFCVMFIWEISARSTGMNSRNTTKMVEHKFVLFATVKAFWALATLLIKANSHTSKVEILTRSKLCHFVGR